MNKNRHTKGNPGREYEILQEAITAFHKATGLSFEEKPLQRGTVGGRNNPPLMLKADGKTTQYRTEIKANLTDTVVGRLAHHFEDQRGKWLVITHYVPPPLAKKMRDLGIQFIDTVGNAYINEPPILVFMHGNKPVGPLLVFMPEQGMLGRAGLQVVFALLCNQGLEKKTYRDIALAADVALGTVAGVLKDLIRQGYLINIGDADRRLTRKRELFEKWTTAYAERLRPKLIGRYSTNRTEFWQEVNLIPYGAQWGGEVAANMLTHYLKPEIVTIYTRRPVNDVVLALKLRKDDDGNVELRERFWKFELNEPRRDLVPPLLVYADLLATTDARNVESARMIYDQYLQRHFRGN